jgi:tetratricopeptide (TPR) repeat protein
MENSLQLALEITAKWSRKLFSTFILILIISFSAMAQKGDDLSYALSGKELMAFNELFFAAEKDFNLGNYKQAEEKYRDLYKITAYNATVCYRLAEVYLGDGNREDAIFFGERAVELDDENKWFKLGLVTIYRQFRIPKKQVGLLSRLIESDPENPDYRFELATVHRQMGELDEAIEQLDALEERIGMHELITSEKKQIYLEKGDVDAAAEELQKLIEAFPKELNYYGILGQVYEINGLPEKALKVYNTMLEISPNDPRPHLDLANYYQKKQDREKSLFHLNKAIRSPDLDIDKKIAALLSLFNASETDSTLRNTALEMLESVVAVHSSDPKAYTIYGDFLSQAGFNDKALNAYKKAVQLDGGSKYQIWEQILLIQIQTLKYDSLAVSGPKAIDLFPNQPLPYLFSGIAFSFLENLKESAYYLEEGLVFVIGNPRLKEQFYTQLADVYHRLENHERSDGYFDKSLAVNPVNPTALNNYAYYLSVRGEKLEKALEMTEESNRLSPNNAVFLDTWAWVLYKNGDYALALEKIERVVQLSAKPNGEILEHYGDILLKNGKTEEALSQYQKALKLGGTTPEIHDKIKSLSSP